jgi:hypothetical protein
MKTKLIVCAGILLLSAAACDNSSDKADEPAASSAKADTSAAGTASGDTKPAKAEPKKLDSSGLEKLADDVAFSQAEEKDGKFSGKLENAGGNDIGRLEYKAFAYDDAGKLLEMVKGKYPRKLAAGASVDLEVGPFTKTAGKSGVTVELVVSWMNVDGTSWQRPVPKDRPKGGPNNALKK